MPRGWRKACRGKSGVVRQGQRGPVVRRAGAGDLGFLLGSSQIAAPPAASVSSHLSGLPALKRHCVGTSPRMRRPRFQRGPSKAQKIIRRSRLVFTGEVPVPARSADGSAGSVPLPVGTRRGGRLRSRPRRTKSIFVFFYFEPILICNVNSAIYFSAGTEG